MKLLITLDELKNKKSRELVPIECCGCSKTFYKEQHYALAALNGIDNKRLKFCSSSCSAANQIRKDTKKEISCHKCLKSFSLAPARIRKINFCSRSCCASHYALLKRKIKSIKPERIFKKTLDLNCSFCHSSVKRKEYQFNLSKSKTFFCSKTCKTRYANKYQIVHKPKSRAETILVNLIKDNFPNLEIKENIRNILPSGLEIDIFIPSSKLAIELNGPVHYIPIYGQNQLDKVKNKDLLKYSEINQLGLNLIVIDISRLNSRQSTDLFINEYFYEYIKPILE